MNIGMRPLLENWQLHALKTDGVRFDELRKAIIAKGYRIEPCQFCERETIVRPDLEQLALKSDQRVIFACTECATRKAIENPAQSERGATITPIRT